MSKIKVAINGFGRIGRIVLRQAIKNENVQVVAINDLSNVETLAHLFKYDSIHRVYQGDVSVESGNMVVDGNNIKVFAEKDPAQLPWGDLDIDFVIESTGIFRSKETAGLHVKAGAKKVMVSAPPKGDGIKAYVLGVNEELITAEEDIISNASCTTNSCAHIVKHIDENWGINKGFLTTIHAFTSDQRLHDAPHSDLRRARAASRSMIPTSTGAANAVIKLFPHLKGKFVGSAIRVPTEDGSITEMTFLVNKDVSADEINASFKDLASNKLNGILKYNEEPIVSVDIISNPHSGIFDSTLTSSVGNLIKVSSWYDNEFGYSTRCVDLLEYYAKKFM
ncbi:MAG: type I glyceraldehyde-3-phosphate dehydrogenase [Bacteroidia bacterium]